MDPNGNGKRTLPLLREIFRRQRQDSDPSNKPCLARKFKITLTTWDRQQHDLENLTRRFGLLTLDSNEVVAKPKYFDKNEKIIKVDIQPNEYAKESHFLQTQKALFNNKQKDEGLPPWETFFQDEINRSKKSEETIVQETSTSLIMLFNPIYPQETVGIIRPPQHRMVDNPYSLCYGDRIQGYEPGTYKAPPIKISIPILIPSFDEECGSRVCDDYNDLMNDLFNFKKDYKDKLADIGAESPPEWDSPNITDHYPFLDTSEKLDYSFLLLDEEEIPWDDCELDRIDSEEVKVDLSVLTDGTLLDVPTLKLQSEYNLKFEWNSDDDITPTNSTFHSPPKAMRPEPKKTEKQKHTQTDKIMYKKSALSQTVQKSVQSETHEINPEIQLDMKLLELPLIESSVDSPLSSNSPPYDVKPFDPNVLFACLSRLRTSMEQGRQGGAADSPDLAFVYDDTDTHGNEIAELYSYTEQPELQLNVKAFEDQMEAYNLPPSWQRLSVEKRKSVVMKLLDQLEISQKPLRMRSARCLLYICQGCWAEMQSDTEQQHWARINSILLYQMGVFNAFVDLLNIEIENATAAHVAMRKIAVSLVDSQDLRVILSVLYTITEVIRNEMATENTEYKCELEEFCYDIGNASGEDLLALKLLGMVTKFCSGAAPHFPMKKVLLLLWKLILVSLGGMAKLRDLKADKRQRAGLPHQDEDTMEIAKTMRSSSPPASASDLLEAQNQKRNTRPFRRSLIKQSSLDDQETISLEMVNDNGDDLNDMNEYDERRPTEGETSSQMYQNQNVNTYNCPASPPTQHDILPRGLPWKPKVRQKDIDMFLDGSRQKFLGYCLPGDSATLFGLPEPIHEGVKILKNHVYTSLAELQIQKEEEIARNPLSTPEDEIEMNPAEILYQAMLPNLPQYMIALLKILLAAAPTSRAKTDSINIMADVLPEEMPMTVLQSMKLGIDVNRHKEIIVKAVSAILLLLLKHFKLNHIYQFEFMSQHLVFANCIPLVLKFFNQNIMAYVGAKNVIPILDFPSCVIGDQPELTAESLEIGDAAPFSWRNMFSCINLLRILNKLTKWKHSRIMMLVVFKSAPILKRTLKVRHAMTQLYVLKLLKMQTKYLGRQWRKSNMKTISAIYQKVRHRLNDDWAYGNDLDARPWDFQAEECALRASVDRFNNRRYSQIHDSEFEPVDNCITSVLGNNHELSRNFKEHYHLWLEQEVFDSPIDWDKLLLNNK